MRNAQGKLWDWPKSWKKPLAVAIATASAIAALPLSSKMLQAQNSTSPAAFANQAPAISALPNTKPTFVLRTSGQPDRILRVLNTREFPDGGSLAEVQDITTGHIFTMPGKVVKAQIAGTAVARGAAPAPAPAVTETVVESAVVDVKKTEKPLSPADELTQAEAQKPVAPEVPQITTAAATKPQDELVPVQYTEPVRSVPQNPVNNNNANATPYPTGLNSQFRNGGSNPVFQQNNPNNPRSPLPVPTNNSPAAMAGLPSQSSQMGGGLKNPAVTTTNVNTINPSNTPVSTRPPVQPKSESSNSEIIKPVINTPAKESPSLAVEPIKPVIDPTPKEVKKPEIAIVKTEKTAVEVKPAVTQAPVVTQTPTQPKPAVVIQQPLETVSHQTRTANSNPDRISFGAKPAPVNSSSQTIQPSRNYEWKQLPVPATKPIPVPSAAPSDRWQPVAFVTTQPTTFTQVQHEVRSVPANPSTVTPTANQGPWQPATNVCSNNPTCNDCSVPPSQPVITIERSQPTQMAKVNMDQHVKVQTQGMIYDLMTAVRPVDREAAASALRNSTHAARPEVRCALLRAAVADPAPSVRAHCIECLSALGYDEKDYREHLQAVSGYGPALVRNAASEALARMPVR